MSLFGNTNEENKTNTIDTTVKLINLKDRQDLPNILLQIKQGTILIINTNALPNRMEELRAEDMTYGYSLALEGTMTKISDHMLLVGNNKLEVEHEAHKQIAAPEELASDKSDSTRTAESEEKN